ncbi:MAG: NAD(P)H-dependent oxidoreductase [Candidatus Omnitrophica bacterium]|nr:NAD(P)H-dependent oxidoreductase [Candidatus Omnitrophota bacterium]
MKHLIVYCHPNPASFNHAILEKVKETFENGKNEVRIRDLYQLDLDPVLKGKDLMLMKEGKVEKDVEEEQKNIVWADTITFIYPIWWTGLPARLKGYIERVFTPGFAYAYTEKGPEGLLKSKKVLILNTTGSPRERYEAMGMFKSFYNTMDTGIFEFCGMKVIGHEFFSAVPFVSQDHRADMLDEVEQIAERIA